MSTTRMDYTEKIQFAEQWLEKAKHEFENGSPMQAGSHVMLAIAEMETLKRNLFGEQDVKKTYPASRDSHWLYLKPAFALVLFLAALMLFILATRQPETQLPYSNTPVISDASSSHNWNSDSYFHNRLSPYFESILSDFDLTEIQVIEKSAADPVMVHDHVLSEPSAKPVIREIPRTRQVRDTSPKTEAQVAKEPSNVEASSQPVTPSTIEKNDRIFPVNILRETIYVANENLKNE